MMILLPMASYWPSTTAHTSKAVIFLEWIPLKEQPTVIVRGFEDDPDNAQRYRFEDKIADSFEEDVVLSAADRFRCFIHAVYDIIIAPSYRIPKKVKKIRVYPDNCFFGVCPRCNNSIDREYQTFCNCCGQRLDWSKLDEAEEQWIGGNR